MNRVLYTFVIFILFTLNVGSQLPSWTSLQFQDSPTFNEIQMDSLGFIWGISRDGLYKYDGYELVKKLSHKFKFSTFSIDKDKHFVIGTDSSMIITYDPYTQEYKEHLLPYENFPVSNIYCPDFGNSCLLISYSKGVLYQNGFKDTLLSTDNILVSNEVYKGIILKSNIILATDQGLQTLVFVNNEIKSAVKSIEDGMQDIIVTNIELQNDDLWITNFDTNVSLIKSDGTILHYPLPIKSKINHLEVNNTQIFLSTDNGLFKLETNSWVKKYPRNDISNINCTKVDQEGNIWLSDSKNSLVKGNLLFQKLDIRVEQIQALCKLDNAMWIGNKTGLYVYNEEGETKLLDRNITCIQTFGDLVWVGTFSSGVFILDKTGNILSNVNAWHNYPDQSILCLSPDQNGAYISTLTGLVYLESKVQYKNQFVIDSIETIKEMGGAGYIYQILKQDNTIYLATDRQGLKILTNGKLNHLTAFENGKKIGSVYSMVADKTGILWFSSSKEGLGYIENNKAFLLSDEKTSTFQYTSLIPLSNGNIMMIRPKSADILNPKTREINSYDKPFNAIDETPFLNTFANYKNVTYFAQNHQVYQYESFDEQKTMPNIQIDWVKVNLDLIPANKTFHQNENHFEFHFTGSWLTDSDKLVYQYMLEGADNNWRTTKDRTVAYPKLHPGEYTFRVKCSINNNFNSQIEKTFSFHIKRSFYNTWWFWISLTFIAVSIILKMLDIRKKAQLKNSEIEKKHIESRLENLKSQLNPHFLFNSFNTLVGLIEEDKEKSIHFLETLTDFYRLVLEYGQEQLVDFEEELKFVKLYVEILNERFQNSIILSLPDAKINSLIPPLTLQLLIENAVKHNQLSNANKLTIKIYSEENFICVKNEKSLKPFPPKSLGKGLDNIDKRYKLLNNTSIQIFDNKTNFVVKIPIIALR